ncbi:hypothetical protein NUZ5A_20404 [Candidatus Nitrosotenuis uzonensis]|uniref:Uncharacterized protein n=1 Tax=Candidatus Nitrosotenuis uzonensis TaxID=1407055 RepID=A0A812EZA0_9ARCH|nr:hypothetical protein NUZ5A_20404 [Candidatus Nitrosotenuis uzonensis]
MNITTPPPNITRNLPSNSSVVGNSVGILVVPSLKSYIVLNIIKPPIIATIAPDQRNAPDNMGSIYYPPISMICECQ